MFNEPTSRRRWVGALCLVAAIGMLIGGETIFKTRLSGIIFLIYWCACLVFTVASIFIALLDVCLLQRKTRDEQRALFERIFRGIQARKPERSTRPEEPQNQAR